MHDRRAVTHFCIRAEIPPGILVWNFNAAADNLSGKRNRKDAGMRYWGFITGLALLVMLLMWQFPYMAGSTDRVMNVLYLGFLIALVAGAGAFSRAGASQTLRHTAIWFGIILLVALGYAFRGELRGSRLYGALVPNRVQATAQGGLRLSRAADGHFHLEAEINGAPESFLVDTGASDIILTARAARAAGIDPETLNYTRSYRTANGMVSAAPVKLDSVRLGHVHLRDMPASVHRGPMEESLLGMAFLNRFSAYQVEADTLTLYP